MFLKYEPIFYFSPLNASVVSGVCGSEANEIFMETP